MTLQALQTLFNYHYWANHKILDAAARLPSEQFLAQNTYTFGTLRGELTHILDTEIGWLNLFQHNTTAFFDILVDDSFPTLDALRQRWSQQERAMRDYLAALTDDELARQVRYINDTGEPRERILWHCLYQIVNHATQHRSEAAIILTDYGASPGEIDFITFLNENPL